MAALGSALDLCQATTHNRVLAVALQYGIALKRVQAELDSTVSCSVSLVAACLLLGIADVIVGQEVAALSHLRGTLALLQKRQRTLPCRSNETSAKKVKDEESKFVLYDDLDKAGAILDVVTLSYALGLPPRLPKFTSNVTANVSEETSNANGIELRVLNALRASYGFASQNFRWKYVPQNLKPQSMFNEQSELMTQLFQCVQTLRRAQIASSQGSKFQQRALVLGMQCSACLIYLATLLEPYETAYDRFVVGFRQIAVDAETIIAQNASTENESVPKISLDLGVAQPLFFTAVKCRDLGIRTRAVRFLECTGREGPFDGKHHAIVARRAIDLEESAALSELNNVGLELGMMVPERVRLHAVGVTVGKSLLHCSRSVGAWFSRCRDVASMMMATSPDSYEDPRHWEMWDELLP